MGLRTYTKTIMGHEVKVKAPKATASSIFSELHKLEIIGQHRRELTGVRGQTEGIFAECSQVTWHMCGEPEPLLDPDGFKAECDALFEGLPLLDYSQSPMVDIAKALKDCKAIFDKHVPEEDNRRSPEEETERVQKQETAQAERDRTGAQKAIKDEEEKAKLLTEYPNLERQESSTKTRHALASANIKKHLKKLFPGHDFSVKSSSYSMGSSIRVCWTDGPSHDEVDSFADQFQYNGAMDQTDYVPTRSTGGVFRGLFGSVGYVFCERTIREERYTAAAEDFKKYTEDRQSPWRRELFKEVEETSYYVAPTVPTVQDSGAACTIKDNLEKSLDRHYKASLDPTKNVRVRRNEERGGIEVVFAGKPKSEVLQGLKNMGFRWSRLNRLWWAKETAERWSYAVSLIEPEDGPEETTTTPAGTSQVTVNCDESGKVTGQVTVCHSTKYGAMAQRLDKEIEDKQRPMTQNPTPKRNYQYQSRLHDAENLERLQKLLYALDAAYIAGTVPEALKSVTTKAALSSLVHKGTTGEGGYYQCIPSEKYSYNTPAALAAQKLIEAPETEEDKVKAEARELERLENELKLMKLPGYFPTPAHIVDKMIDLAGIEGGDNILEPSAGTGAILEGLRKAGTSKQGVKDYETEYKISAYEIRPSLVDICKRKRLPVVCADFLEIINYGNYYFDVILMNPPFDKGIDIKHINHALKFLMDGGTLVAICANGSRQRAAFMDRAEHWEDLPEGTFKEMGTGVNSALMVLRKE